MHATALHLDLHTATQATHQIDAQQGSLGRNRSFREHEGQGRLEAKSMVLLRHHLKAQRLPTVTAEFKKAPRSRRE
jgi:hypothetical protein